MKNRTVLALIIPTLAACGGGSSGNNNPNGVNSAQQSSGSIDLSKYVFPTTSKTMSYDYYEYDANDLLSNAIEADLTDTYTVTGNKIEILDKEGDIETITITTNNIESALENASSTVNRFTNIGRQFDINYNGGPSSPKDFTIECTIVKSFASFSMMSDKAEVSYPTYNNVIQENCISTYSTNTPSGNIVSTDVRTTYYAEGVGEIGNVDYDCDKRTGNTWYLDDLTAENCDDEVTYIEALGPKI